MSESGYVQVAVNLPLKSVFDYAVPPQFRNRVAVGKRVWVPFRNRTIVGFVVKVSNTTGIRRTRDIKDIIDDEPILSKEMLELTRWIADYYFCSWGEAIESAIPGPFKRGKTSIRLRKDIDSIPGVDENNKLPDKILTGHQNKALTKIIPYLKDADPLVRNIAHDTLTYISGRDFGKNPHQWFKWWRVCKQNFSI